MAALMMDEMSIRKHIQWDGDHFVGYVDIGTGIDSDSLPPAKEALVFQLVGLNDSWKIPVAYFLIDGLDATERSQLVLQCLERAHEAGVKVCHCLFSMDYEVHKGII